MKILKFISKDNKNRNIQVDRHLAAEIVVIGGGVTGLGIARDAAIRGFKVILIEKRGLGSGTSGHFHGLLHSGARYAVSDTITAASCMRESQILRKIAAAAVIDTGGLFLALNDDEAAYSEKLIPACKSAGIPISEVPLEEVRKHESKIAKSPRLLRALKVPDAYIDGEILLKLNRHMAETADVPATILTHTEIIGFNQQQNRISAVLVQDARSDVRTLIECQYVINAAGAWAGKIGNLAGIGIDLVWDRGAMVALEDQPSGYVLNRCRPPSDGDILVPVKGMSIIGTTSVVVDDIDNREVESWEVNKLLYEAELMVPGLSSSKIRNVFTGIRPLFDAGVLEDGRGLSRYFRVLDHTDGGISNFISVVGGKVTIYRLMAETAVDVICKKESTSRLSRTAEISMIL